MAMTRQKARDAALLLPLLGLLLLMPPFVGLVDGAASLAGVPAIVLYIFLIWAALICTGRWLGRRLPTASENPDRPTLEEPDDADA